MKRGPQLCLLLVGFLFLLNSMLYAEEKHTIVKEEIESTIRYLDPTKAGLSFLVQDPWIWCKLYPLYDFKSMENKGTAYNFDEGALFCPFPAGFTYDSDYIGYLLEFGEQWGGKEKEKVQFRNGKVGSCKVMPIFVAEGTEAKLNDKVYVYRNEKWEEQKLDEVRSKEIKDSSEEIINIENLSLGGILWEGEKSKAIIMDNKTGKTHILVKGELLGGVKVEEIEKDKVTLEYQGKKVDLSIGK